MLTTFTDWLIYSILNLDKSSHFSGMLHFFIYDSIKIFFMLFCVIFSLGVLRSYIPEQKLKKWLISKGIFGNFIASLFGALTPFCSCSGIPIFLSFVRVGVPLGVTFSFLITSPLVNEYLVVLMVGYFGWKVTGFYVLSGVIIGVLCGIVMGKMRLEKYLEKDMVTSSVDEEIIKYSSFKERINFGLIETKWVIKRLWRWIILGIAIGAVIHNYVPKEFIQDVISKTGLLSVPIAVLLGVPMYGSCAAIVPIAVVLFQKGVPLGTAIAFMMATAGLSLPEAIILKRAMKLKLLIIFFTITAISITITGYLFNLLK